MDVKILRGQSNKVLFMECSGKFIDTIIALMQAPLGEVLGAISEESDEVDGPLPGSALSCSVTNLHKQAELFSSTQEPFKHADLEELLGNMQTPKQSKPTIKFFRGHACHSQIIGKAVKVTSAGQAWQCNAAFKAHNDHDFEVKMSIEGGLSIEGGFGMMLGIAPASVNVQTQIYNADAYCLHINGPGGNLPLYGKDGTNNKSFGFILTGKAIYMKLTTVNGSKVLQYANEGGSYITAPFNNIIDSDLYCPIVCFSAPNQNITMEPLAGEPVKVPKQTVKPEVQFLVTNRMEMFQSSSTLAIELIAKNNGESLKGLLSETRRIKASSLRRMLIGALLGRDDILDFAFPMDSQLSAKQEDEDSSENSENSFLLTWPSDSNKA